VGCAGVGSANNSPPRVIPQAGKVSNDIGKSHREVTGDVLQHDESRSQRANGSTDEWVEVSLIVLPLPIPCMRKRLTWISAGEDIDRLHDGPVDGGDVAEVGDAGMMCGEHLARGWLDLRVPRQLAADHRLHCDVESAITGEQRTDADHVRLHTAMTAPCDSRRVDGR